MKNNKLSAPVSYLPLQKFHIVPIVALDPASLKASAKKVKRDREKIKHNTLLNAIAKALGIKGGFAEYQNIYASELIPFMNKHGMTKRVDLLKQRQKGFDTYLTDITHQDLSERLFFSGLEFPEKIFTGYNFDYEHTINDGYEYFKSILRGKIDTHGLQPYQTIMDQSSIADIKGIIEHNIKISHANPTLVLDCPYDKKPLKSFFDLGKKDYEPDSTAIQAGIDRYNCFAGRTMLDVVVGSLIKDLEVSFNLLGDSLVSPVKHHNEPELYWGHGDSLVLKQQKELATIKFNLFRERIELGGNGWVEVLPFNNSLIFLRGSNGQYDFIFKNQREKIFKHQIFGESLKRADIPSFMSNYQFHRWHYFEYQGWRYMDKHNAENRFYNQENSSSAHYPGMDVVLQTYHEAMHNFTPKPGRSRSELPEFKKVIVNNKALMISNLITIDDLCQFKEANSDYLDYRTGDELDSVNVDIDTALPATLTWFDALSYVNWFENKTREPIRLLNLSEYKSLREMTIVSKNEFVDPLDNVLTDDCLNMSKESFQEFIGNLEHTEIANASGKEVFEFLDIEFPNYRAYVSGKGYQELTGRFWNTEMYHYDSGLNFLKSDSFAEWLQEGTCIRSGNLMSFYNDDFHTRSKPPLNSTGKYKDVKIGFRLCYDLSAH
ncbi:hypothetical protein [Moritella marina]|uniref:hypothetical protein n=1 Tax=Moritella marina TaxID=90736 RepID=UPI00370407C4